MRKIIITLLAGIFLACIGVPGTVGESKAASQADRKKMTQHRMEGLARWYGGKNFEGSKTASGEIFDDGKLTGAHRTLPYGTKVRVTNLKNNKPTVVTINDTHRRSSTMVIDVSRAAAVDLDMLKSGKVPVRLEIVN